MCKYTVYDYSYLLESCTVIEMLNKLKLSLLKAKYSTEN